jgi:hypothetical protein
MKTIKKLSYCLFLGVIFVACQTNQEEKKVENPEKSAPLASEEVFKRGEYLVSILGCDDCHTPKEFTEKGPRPDMKKRFAGYLAELKLPKIDKNQLKDWVLFNMHNTAAVGPWGVSFSANITSDATGIGTWTEEQFIRAMREGKAKGLANSRPLLPPMPWQIYGKMTDDDLKAIFAYLKKTTPVKNQVPAPIAPNEL